MRRLPLILTVIALAACGDLQHESPFDPATPPDQQARTTFSGTIALEPVGGVTPSRAGVQVSLAGTGHDAVTDAAGAYAITGVPPGTYTLQAVAPDYQVGAIPGVTATLDTGGTTIPLPALALVRVRADLAGTVDLKLPDDSLEASGGASVTLSSAGGTVPLAPPAGLVRALSTGVVGTAVTDAAGDYVIPSLPAPLGSYTLAASKLGYVTQTTTVTFQDGAFVVQTVQLAIDPGALVGTVAAPGALDAAGIVVRARGTTLGGTPWEDTTVTDALGAYRLSGLPAGTYAVSWERADFVTASTLATVEPGEDTDLGHVELVRETGAVSGNVALSAGAIGGGFAVEANRSGTVVTLTDGSGPVAPPAVTDASGNYVFPSVPAAVGAVPYLLTATRPNYGVDTALVLAAGRVTNLAPSMTLEVSPATLTGVAAPYDNLQHDGTVNADGSGVRIDVTGTAFNGTAYAAAVFTTNAPVPGAWTAANLPPGTFDVVATSPSRRCEAIARTVAGPGASVPTAGVLCTDAVPPSAPTLGIPTGSGAQPGFTRTSSVAVSLTAQAGDPVNFRGYAYVTGATPDWDAAATVDGAPASLTFTSLAPDASNVLWVRAVDWVGNAGPAVAASVVQDSIVPPATVLETPRAYVDATTTSVTLRGAEADANFLGYESCGWTQAATTACPASCSCASSGPCTCSGAGGSCTLDATKAVPAAFAVSLTADQRTCLFARGADEAGNTGAVAVAAVTSDLTPPSTAIFAPTYDPTLVTVHADYVDFFLTAAATDAPAGGGTPWKNVAFLEVDTGAGYTALCPAAACHPNDTFAPCAAACGCTDGRLLCSGASFLGLRQPLLGGVANTFQVRAVDVAGNRGPGLSQQVVTAGSGELVQGTTTYDMGPRTLGRLLAVTTLGASKLYELGDDQRLDAGDASCDLGGANGTATYPTVQPATESLVLHAVAASGTIVARRAGPSGLCAAGYTEQTIRAAPLGAWSIFMLSASGERVAWSERTSSTPNTHTLFVQEPGTDGKLGGVGSPAPTVMGSFSAVAFHQLQGDALIEYGSHGGVNNWKVWNAVGGAFSPDDVSDPSRSYTFPSSITGAGLSSDGRMLATFSASGGVMSIRRPGLSGLYGAGDAVVSHTFPAGSVNTRTVVAIEGSHAVAFDSGAPNYLHHWYAGGDATFGTLDDTYATLMPSALSRLYPALGTGLANGQLYFQVGRTNAGVEDPDVWSLDLGALRWESPLTTTSTRVFTNRAGTLFFNPASGGMASRTSDGRQSSTASAYLSASADGDDLVTVVGSTVYHLGPDATGLWFTSGAQPAVAVYSSAQSSSPVAVSGGRAIVRGSDGSVRILEPVAGSLRNGVTAVQIDTLAGSTPSFWGVGLAGPHAFYGCNDGGSIRACYRHAGPNGVFGDADDGATAFLRNPSGVLYYGVQSLRGQGNRLIFSPSYGHVVVLDPGDDGVFNTGDELEWDLGGISTQVDDYDLADDVVAWVDEVAGAGLQVFAMNLRDGTRRRLTDHYSAKTCVAVDPVGRVAWRDSVFAQPIVFVGTP